MSSVGSCARSATSLGSSVSPAELPLAVGLIANSDFEVKNHSDFVALAEYRQVGLGSLDTNLNGSDFDISYLSFRDVKPSLNYGFRP